MTGEQCDDGNLTPGDGCNAFCLLEGPLCSIDEDLGLVQSGQTVSRVLNVAAATDSWVTGCASSGPEIVIRFEQNRWADIEVWFSQQGDHAIGLYTANQVTAVCTATGGVCIDRDPNQPGGVTFVNRPPGVYYLITEGNGPGWAGTVQMEILFQGCLPDYELGSLPVGVTDGANFNTSLGGSVFEAGCSGQSGAEVVVGFTLPTDANVQLDFTQTGDHVFELGEEGGSRCDDYPVSCYDPVGVSSGSHTFARLTAGNYVILSDAYDPGDEGMVDLTLQILPPTP